MKRSDGLQTARQSKCVCACVRVYGQERNDSFVCLLGEKSLECVQLTSSYLRSLVIISPIH